MYPAKINGYAKISRTKIRYGALNSQPRGCFPECAGPAGAAVAAACGSAVRPPVRSAVAVLDRSTAALLD